MWSSLDLRRRLVRRQRLCRPLVIAVVALSTGCAASSVQENAAPTTRETTAAGQTSSSVFAPRPSWLPAADEPSSTIVEPVPATSPSVEIAARIAALPFVGAFGFDPLSGYIDVTEQEQRISACMEARGFDYVPFQPDITPQVIASSSVGVTGRPDVDSGYWLSSTFLGTAALPPAVDPNEAIRASLGLAELDAYWLAFRGVDPDSGDGAPTEGPSGCVAQSRADTSAVDESMSQLIDRARADVVTEARSDERVQAADSAWVSCMAEATVITTSKFDYVDRLREEFARLYDAVVAANANGTPPAENDVLLAFAEREQQLAAFDLACDDRTSFTLVYLDALGDAQQAFLDRNAALLGG